MAETPEQEARRMIDVQLAAAGWAVQNLDQINLSAARGVAVREMQSQGGPADYVLFVDGKALGVPEAKKAGTTLSGVAEQSQRYTAVRKWIPQLWADPLPFTYESTGIETNFRDQRDPDSRSRPVFAFHQPEHLVKLVQQPDTQGFALLKNIREADDIAQKDHRFYEVHPEVSFRAMNGGAPLKFTKKSWNAWHRLVHHQRDSRVAAQGFGIRAGLVRFFHDALRLIAVGSRKLRM